MSTFPAGSTTAPLSRELEWNDLSVILAVCRQGSLSGAARVLGYNHSTVFRKISAIEQKTGVRFFERLPDGYRMTEAGESALRTAERIEAEVHALGREVLGQDMRLQGKVRITSPEGMSATLLPQMLRAFHQRHPDVTFDVAGGHGAFDLGRREADIAIRATSRPPDTALGRKVCEFRFALYASPDYPKLDEDIPLAEHDWCMIPDTIEWLVPLVWKKVLYGERRVVFASGATMPVVNAARSGLGLTMMPCYVGDLMDGLARVSGLIEPLTLELWVLTHPDLRHTARVKVLMQYLYEMLGEQADLFEGKRARKGSHERFML